ncbi:MAG TPA: hypothetical protein DDW49_04095 [Deltaproteobacteria bacterium]|nr:MAG: hypothetical protein A2048_04010 [Deltaproteobacteria bacterium GWA2_45_12]HBF12561.1 hypothetical protein [Deltaproteobacteria bacterium]
MNLTLEQFLKHFRHPTVFVTNPHAWVTGNVPFLELSNTTSMEAPKTFHAFLQDNPLLAQNIDKVFQTHGSFNLRDIDIKGPFKRIHPMDVEIFFATDDKIELTCLIFYDRTLGEKFEEHKKRIDQINTLTTIASGLAHEIKNPLAGIKAASQMLSKTLKNRDSREYAEIILKETIRVNRLISDLMNLTKPRKLLKKKCNINQILHQILVLQKEAAPSFVKWHENFDPSLPAIKADPEALSQVFLNLIQNAWQSLAKKGFVKVQTRFVTDFRLKQKNKTRQVIGVTIEDTGVGLSLEQVQQIFLPFFTTKPEGTGLGLTLCHQLIEKHGGDIQVTSVPGSGSIFSVYLPV